MSEANLQRACVTELRRRGAWSITVHGTQHGRVGTPDLIAIYKGHGLVLELKQPGGQTSRLQEFELEQAASAGATTGIVHSLGELRAILNRLDRAA